MVTTAIKHGCHLIATFINIKLYYYKSVWWKLLKTGKLHNYSIYIIFKKYVHQFLIYVLILFFQDNCWIWTHWPKQLISKTNQKSCSRKMLTDC